MAETRARDLATSLGQAVKLNKYRDVELWIKNEYFSALGVDWMDDKEKIRKLKLEIRIIN